MYNILKNSSMKKSILLFAIIVFAAFVSNAQVSSPSQSDIQKKEAEKQKMDQERIEQQKAQQEQAAAQANNPNAPIIKFDKMEHDYGTIEQNADGNCEFKFTNEGKEPLILSNVRSSCGCTVPTWPRQPILPGQSEVIQVKYDTKRVGLISKTITVYSNAKEATVTLKIKGNIQAGAAEKMPEKTLENSATPINK
jgi:hypothetical protein